LTPGPGGLHCRQWRSANMGMDIYGRPCSRRSRGSLTWSPSAEGTGPPAARRTDPGLDNLRLGGLHKAGLNPGVNVPSPGRQRTAACPAPARTRTRGKAATQLVTWLARPSRPHLLGLAGGRAPVGTPSSPALSRRVLPLYSPSSPPATVTRRVPAAERGQQDRRQAFHRPAERCRAVATRGGDPPVPPEGGPRWRGESIGPAVPRRGDPRVPHRDGFRSASRSPLPRPG